MEIGCRNHSKHQHIFLLQSASINNSDFVEDPRFMASKFLRFDYTVWGQNCPSHMLLHLCSSLHRWTIMTKSCWVDSKDRTLSLPTRLSFLKFYYHFPPSTANGFFWTAFGFGVMDWIMIISNGTGAILGFIQMLIWLVIPSRGEVSSAEIEIQPMEEETEVDIEATVSITSNRSGSRS
jgi:hypothetical protein